MIRCWMSECPPTFSSRRSAADHCRGERVAKSKGARRVGAEAREDSSAVNKRSVVGYCAGGTTCLWGRREAKSVQVTTVLVCFNGYLNSQRYRPTIVIAPNPGRVVDRINAFERGNGDEVVAKHFFDAGDGENGKSDWKFDGRFKSGECEIARSGSANCAGVNESRLRDGPRGA